MKMLSIEQELKSNSYPVILSWEEAKTAAIVFL